MADSGAQEGAQTAAEEGARPKLRHRARGFVKNRSGKQKITGLAAVALLVTAPFGGLKAEPASKPAPLRLGHRIDLGPIDVTVQKVLSIGSLSATIKPSRPRNRLFVVEALVRNRTDEPQVAIQLPDAFYGRHLGVVPATGQSVPKGSMYFVKDGSYLSGALNPGITYQVVVVFEQDGAWQPGTGSQRPLLGLGRYVFRTDDPGTLDPDSWILDRGLVEGRVTVEVKK